MTTHTERRSRRIRRPVDEPPRTCDVRLDSLPPNRLLTAGEAARHIPGHPSPSSLARWARSGCIGADGEIHRLPSCRIGRRLAFRPADLLAFFARLGDVEGGAA